jgi:hypothetical protein
LKPGGEEPGGKPTDTSTLKPGGKPTNTRTLKPGAEVSVSATESFHFPYNFLLIQFLILTFPL